MYMTYTHRYTDLYEYISIAAHFSPLVPQSVFSCLSLLQRNVFQSSVTREASKPASCSDKAVMGSHDLRKVYVHLYVQSGNMKSSNYIQEGKAWPDAAETSSLSPPFRNKPTLSTCISMFLPSHLIPFYEAESIIFFASLRDRRSAWVLPLNKHSSKP